MRPNRFKRFFLYKGGNMEEESINIEDGSNDKGYFTQVPNYILNHSTAIAQALYLQLKKLAGDKGTAFPSQAYLMDKLGVSKPTLIKEFTYLLEKCWIKRVEDKIIPTAGGNQKVKAYTIVDLWKVNMDYYSELYSKGVKNNIPLNDKGVKQTAQGGKIDTPKGVKNRPTNNINNNISNNKDFLKIKKEREMDRLEDKYILDENHYRTKNTLLKEV